MANIIEQLEDEQMTREVPEFSPGDTVVVKVSVNVCRRLKAWLLPSETVD